MDNVLDIVKRANEAFDTKDANTLRNVLHPNYSCVGPDMECHSPDELIAVSKSMPFQCRSENVEYIVAGDKVVMTCDWVATGPVSFRNRMCDVITVQDGKVSREELFYDTAKIPKEAADLMKQAAQSHQRAA